MLPALISVPEADRLLSAFSALSGAPWPVESVALADAAGRILREDITADRAYPAQDRSRMDGIAISHEDWVACEKGARAFAVAGLARAGDPRIALSRLPERPHDFKCIEIMTGAPCPEGADTVIPYEDILVQDGVARVRAESAVRPGQFLHKQGSDCAHGAVLVRAGVRLQAAQLAIAASVGASRLSVTRRPRVAIVSTGDELIAADAAHAPLPHQIRASNAHGLAALLTPWAETTLHSCGDDPAALSAVLEKALSSCDMLLVSGGVSAGKFDAVPTTLEKLGVTRVFHKVLQKPGKPLWFGVLGGFEKPDTTRPRPENPRGKIPVFGLPGNPVSALTCARRFALPLLWANLGWDVSFENMAASVRLAVAVDAPSTLTQYLPVRVYGGEGSLRAEPLAVNGSGDFAGLGNSDGFVELSPHETHRNHYPAGAILSFFPWSP
jgi:molybdopterin molybdotransferase